MREHELLTVRDLAARLKMSTTWVRLKVYSNEIPYHRLGRSLRFVWSEVASALGLPVTEEGQSPKER